jgi:hypothetical protein
MKKLKILFIGLLVLSAQNSFAGLLNPSAKITVKVLDMKGNPISGAKVNIGFSVSKAYGMGPGTGTEFVKGLTDSEGKFEGSADSGGNCNINVEKKEFYDSNMGYEFKNVSTLRRWDPWNPVVDIVLKEKQNPIPMYAKRTDNLKVPVLEKPVGYDLEKGDWVAPYGKGIINDFIFNCKTQIKGRVAWTTAYKVIFSNAMDGIQEYVADKNDHSMFRWPYEASDNGYKPELVLSDSYDAKQRHIKSYDEKKLYVFRVRTQVDEKGSIISARYGKIKGDIELLVHGTLRFEYYFNPTGSRNLEYNRDAPLFEWENRVEHSTHEVTGP